MTDFRLDAFIFNMHPSETVCKAVNVLFQSVRPDRYLYKAGSAPAVSTMPECIRTALPLPLCIIRVCKALHKALTLYHAGITIDQGNA